jgi:pimeloyl-ACP methyl ester carboxylesterase
MDKAQIPDYSVHGAGNATTVYLLHGAYGAKEYWRYLIETLTNAGYRCVAWDMPGYGISPVPNGITIESAAHALLALMESTRTSRNVVLGHSTGGCVAQQAYDLAPSMIHGLVLSSTMHTFNHSGPEWKEYFMRTRLAPILEHGKSIAEYAPDLLRAVMGPGASGPIVDWIIANVKLMRNESFKAAIHALSQYEREDILPRIKVPVLCICGEVDVTCPPNVMKAMADAITRSTYHEMKGVGHFGWAERPEEYNRVLLEFLQRNSLGA